jgi:FtsH-binding integral membrane protein
MPVERLSVVEKPERQRQTESPTSVDPFPLSPEPQTTTETSNAPASGEQTLLLLSQTMAVLAAIAGLTSARLLLLLVVCGAFYLATIAANTQSNASIAVLVVYAVLIVLPLVWLDSTVRRRPPG